MLHQLKPITPLPAPTLAGLKIYADGASLAEIKRIYGEGLATGFTTNPSLMARAGVPDYEAFARELTSAITTLPLSFEVISDDLAEMRRQARKIASWGANVYVKLPITNTRGESCLPLARELSAEGVQLNVTALLTLEQTAGAVDALNPDVPSIISIFAGRIADTGIDPVPVMRAAVAMASIKPNIEILWASVREVLNLYQAQQCGCHIITATPDVLKKVALAGKDLNELSLETVAMFYQDATAAGFKL